MIDAPRLHLPFGFLGRLDYDPGTLFDFCTRHDLLGDLKTAIRLAEQHFGRSNARLVLFDDPEEDNQWLSIVIDTSLDSDAAFEAFETYTDAWVRAVSPDKAMLISLDYNSTNGD